MEKIPATKLLYYHDAYLREFEAKVLEVVKRGQSTSIILDSTAFYPTGGGQPSDKGTIESENGRAKITDVQWNQGRILHLTASIVGKIKQGETVRGVIDWNRRYALMKNHTAAHIMAEAIRRVLGRPVEIVGSGLDIDKVRLDLALENSLRPAFERIGNTANNLVKENRSVILRVMNREEAEKYVENFHESLKTLPSSVDQVRIVEVEGLCACACGGTHVKNTGELGVMKILGRSSKGKGVERLEFTAQN
ncbi:MAG: alanine--tRNA ligase-related protein [Candidatus Bathyarchaeia archaeon]